MQIIRSIQNRIYEIRGERVMLDRDLAVLYETETKSLNLAVKRNLKRFPEDFMFQLTKEEYETLRLKLKKEAEFMMRVSKKISQRILDGDIYFSEDGMKLLGNLKFSDNEE